MNRRAWSLLLFVSMSAAWPAAGPVHSSWNPVAPAELAMSEPKIDKGADAEILFWEVTVTDVVWGSGTRSNYLHYVRAKVFTDRGRDAFARVDIPHLGSVRVSDVEARTIRRNGSAVEIRSTDVYERDLLRTGGLVIKATSFALPAVEAGGIVEYRWREAHSDSLLDNVRLPLAREYPVHQVVYRVKPLPQPKMHMRVQPVHGRLAPLREEGGYYVLSASNIPAYTDEAHSPSQWELTPWVFVRYQKIGSLLGPPVYWLWTAKDWWDSDQAQTEPTPGIRAAARDATSGGGTPAERILALLNAARARVKRSDLAADFPGEQRSRKDAMNAGEAFDRGDGRGSDVVNVFLAMARAVGLDARAAYLSDRDDVTFDGKLMLSVLLSHRVAAVRDRGGWFFLDPANHHEAFGHLRWRQEGQPALIPDKDALTTAHTSTSSPDWSILQRVAKLSLASDGTLEGDFQLRFGGHLAVDHRELEAAMSPGERANLVRDRVAERLPSGEISQVVVEHAADTSGPYTVRYHLRVPGYADRTASRLLLRPSVFEQGRPPEFTAPWRLNPVWFHYAWSEHDAVSIDLPSGYEIESPDSPASAILSGTGRVAARVAVSADGSRLDFTRDFAFGEQNHITFAASDYPQIKTFFDAVQAQAEHTVVLRRKAGSR